VAKVQINGETFQFDVARKPMSEALAIEHALGCRYADWEQDMQGGSARALAGFIWLVWRRDGRDIALADILSGDVEVDLATLDIELEPGEPGYEEQQGTGAPVDPTNPAPGVSSSTGASISGRSLKSSTSARGSSGGSTSASSKP
jgi:hypothetical protein